MSLWRRLQPIKNKAASFAVDDCRVKRDVITDKNPYNWPVNYLLDSERWGCQCESSCASCNWHWSWMFSRSTDTWSFSPPARITLWTVSEITILVPVVWGLLLYLVSSQPVTGNCLQCWVWVGGGTRHWHPALSPIWSGVRLGLKVKRRGRKHSAELCIHW